MENIECNVFKLENGIEYTEILRVSSDNNIYILLSNLNDPTDFYIRKVITEDGLEKALNIDDRKEYEKAVALFLKNAIN